MEGLILFFTACALSGILIPMPEDVSVLAAGATIRTPFHFVSLSVVGAVGLLCRDSFYFFIGHLMGEGVFRVRLVQRFIGPERIAKGRTLVEERGGRAVLVSRFLIGARSTGFLASGALGVRIRDFFFWDAVGLAVSVPVMLGLGFALGEPIMAAFEWILAHKSIVLVVAVFLLGLWGLYQWKRGSSVVEDEG